MTNSEGGFCGAEQNTATESTKITVFSDVTERETATTCREKISMPWIIRVKLLANCVLTFIHQ